MAKHKFKLYDDKVRIIQTGETGIIVDAEGLTSFGEPIYEVEPDVEPGIHQPLTITCTESELEYA